MPNITYKSCYYLFKLLHEKLYFSHVGISNEAEILLLAPSQSNCRNFSCSSINKINTSVFLKLIFGTTKQKNNKLYTSRFYQK